MPSKFYAIDVYNDMTKGFWGRNIFEQEQISQFDWYQRKFYDYISKGIMEMKRGLSWECMEEFLDSSLAYVYLDEMHDYYSVRKDIDVIKRKVKCGGYIQFNDYTRSEVYGIVPDVNEYVNSTQLEAVGYCLSLEYVINNMKMTLFAG